MNNPFSETYYNILIRALEQHKEHDDEINWEGFTWQDVRAPTPTLNKMIIEGWIEETYRSRNYRNYKVSDIAKVTEALSAYVPIIDQVAASAEEEELIVPKDMFDFIVKHDNLKRLYLLALQSDKPVHVIAIGEPATAKTLFLNELARLPGSRYALGGTSSKAGITDFLIETRPRFLIIDEIDKMESFDMDVLLSLMETGIVTRLKRNMRELVHLNTWVFAGANSEKRLSRPLLSRFIIQHLQAYSEADFIDVSLAILTKRELLEPVLASRIILAISGKTKDPRTTVQMARLINAGADVDEAVELVFGS